MFKVSPAGLQTFIDTPNCVLEDRVHYSKVHIPNVFFDGHFQIINFGEFFYCNNQVHRDFLIALYIYNQLNDRGSSSDKTGIFYVYNHVREGCVASGYQALFNQRLKQ